MTAKKHKIFYLALMILACIAFGGNHAMAIEEIPYTVVEQNGDFTLREYPKYIVAETIVKGQFEDVGSEGFRRLAGYINGKNRSKESIAMTAPVNQEVKGEKIAMTAPVNQQKSGNSWRITFVMPGKYTLDSLPEPTDSRVTIKEKPARLMAAIRYSGTWSRKKYEVNRTRLQEWIEQRGFEQIGEPVWARYNPPFMPWFMRRNEVLIPVRIN